MTTATKKITKKDMFNEIIKMMNGEQMSVSAQAVIDFATHEIELLNKKSSSSSGKPTKTQLENEGYKLLSTEYKNCKEKLILQCPEGHIFKLDFVGGNLQRW